MAESYAATNTLVSACKSEYGGEEGIPWAQIIQMILSLLGGCGLNAKRALLIVRRPILTGHGLDLLEVIGSCPACKGHEYEVFGAMLRAGKGVSEATLTKAMAEHA